ncbi:hypothetical protein DFH29DRAFT_797866, partial [Suillus ampliporus]
FSYAHAFASSSPSLPVTLRSIELERASILFNLYFQLAASEDKSSLDGLKHANAYY